MTSFLGRTINERYRLDSMLGDGGMGTVYRAYDLNLDRTIALKLMHAHFARQEEFRARLVQEARTAAQLNHPSVVGIFDFGDSDEGLFIAMEYLDGGSLRDHLYRLQTMDKYLPLAQGLQIAAQIADALHYAHNRGIIHRDVKPGNIILKRLSQPDEPNAQPFRAVLTDFGLVKLQEGADITQSGATLGTPNYMSPEQGEGVTLDGRADLYSLGVVLYELITNQLPFTFQNLAEAIAVHNQGAMPDPPSLVRSDAPKMLDRIVMQALAKDPNDRFTTGADMSAALRSAIVALEGAPTQVMSREEADILERVNEPREGYELHIETPGHPASIVPLTRPVITLGRNADNDIVLPTEGVSRHHARLQATSLGWEALDLGGINGTWLNGRRLRAEEATPLTPGDHLRIGPYELTLKGPEVEMPEQTLRSVPGRTTSRPSDPPPSRAEEEDTVEPLGLFLPRERIPVDPGQQVNLKVEVVNRSDIDDRVSLRVYGLPGNWVMSGGEFVTIPAGETVPISVLIRPPRHPATPTGRQRFRLQLMSQKRPNLKVGAGASLMLGTFVDFDAEMEAEDVRLPATIIVTIQNTGNVTADFSLVARERQGQLRFRGERGRIRLSAGQTANVELEVEPRSQTLFGGGELFPFEVEVKSSSGAGKQLNGSARTGSFLPVTFIYVLVFLLTLACVIALQVLFANRDRLLGGGPAPIATVTTTVAAGIAETETAVAQTAIAETAVAATPAPGNDSDEDGLSNSQEELIGTDPTLPDTDGDRLSDGEEMLNIGSDPLDRDTDDDILIDGDEVLVYGTDPTLPDTDGDGIPDGVEIAEGTNPVVADFPTGTPTSTPAVTATPSVTASPVVVTATPEPVTETPIVVTNTAVPSTATATNTPQPAATATPTWTPTTPATATATGTPTITATPTNTPEPNPSFACASQPPLIDGNFDINEWNEGFLFQFAPEENPDNLVEVYGVRDATNLYMVFLINDDTDDVTDSLRLLFDTNNNGGDPDSADRFFQVTREGALTVAAGIGSNTDTREWNPDYESENWTAVTGTVGGAQWVVEMQIAAAELQGLANPFGMMTQVLLTGSLATWPEGAASTMPTTWQDIDNPVCQ